MKNKISTTENYDINETFNFFTKTIKQTVDIHAPIRKRTRKEKRKVDKSWLTKAV